jgi:hypothetical protein
VVLSPPECIYIETIHCMEISAPLGALFVPRTCPFAEVARNPGADENNTSH